MGYLVLPSTLHNQFHTINGIDQAEAEQFIADFTARIVASRKIKAESLDDEFITYRLVDNLSDYYLPDIAKLLRRSTASGTRGNRAVFIDESTDTILVGTTVIYSINWATTGFVDDSIPSILLNLDSHIDKVDMVETETEDDDADVL